ncbi:hypothetical protein [Bacillus sp. EB01]|uniref:hypothetical protein n=1 Tax=Bacillus sp. EB01 TaxID=1347086 RepID=UPI0005C4C6FC|nr:hypothetical protein [Bacillus sp. EB01]
MEAIIIMGVYCLIMGSIVLFASGLVSYFFPKIHVIFILAASALAGVLASFVFDVGTLFAIIFNIIFSGMAVALGRFGRYLKNKTEVEPESILH